MDRQNRRDPDTPRENRILRRHRRRPPQPCCGCDLYQPQWLTGTDRTMAVVTGGIAAGPGEAITFTDGCDSGDTIRLHGPGVYYAMYTLAVPGDSEANIRLFLHLDGTPLPESCLHIDNGDGARHACAQAMFEIDQPATLQLITALPLRLQYDGPCPLISIAVFRIG